MPKITTTKKFLKKDKRVHDYLVNNGYSHVPNPGCRDYIIVDTINKEFTYGEWGVGPFCDVSKLNKYHESKNLKELMSGEYFY